MKLQILIPHYKESEEIVGHLLTSILWQKGVDFFSDFEVIIVNDGDECLLSQDFLDSYPFTIKYFVKVHNGVSAARNYALDKADADYVMFCDADDIFFGPWGLKTILTEEREYDELSIAFLEERGGKYIRHKTDGTFIHSKVFRRQFLIDNNIRFKEDITAHEDVYFVSLAQCCAQNFIYSEDDRHVFYCWQETKGSVSRTKDFMRDTFDMYIQSKTYLLEDLVARGHEDKARYCVPTVVYDAFLEWNYISHSKQRKVKRFWKNYKHYYYMLTEEELEEVAQHMYEKNGFRADTKRFIEEYLDS